MTTRSSKLALIAAAVFVLLGTALVGATYFVPPIGANWDKVCQRATMDVIKVKGGYLVVSYGAKKVQDNSEMITCNNGQRVHL